MDEEAQKRLITLRSSGIAYGLTRRLASPVWTPAVSYLVRRVVVCRWVF